MDILQIRKTYDYDQFKTIVGNRQRSQTHLKNLAASIGQTNLMEYQPIVVNEKFEVIDGQHRLAVAKQNNIPVYFVVVDGATLADVQLLNSNLKPWSMQDYLESHIATGNDDYKMLKDFAGHYGLSLSVSMTLLSGTSLKPHDLIQKFKDGQFKVVNLKRAIETADKLLELKPYTEGDTWKAREFITALHMVYRKIDHKRLLAKVRLHKQKIGRKALVKDYLREFEDICNYRTRNTLRFY